MTSELASKRTGKRLGAPLADDLRSKLATLVEQLGENATCARVGVTHATLARALAGLGVQRGTVALIQAGLAGGTP